MTDLIDIYDDQMRHLGRASRDSVHKTGHWHKTFHCWIVSAADPAKSVVVFQRRSREKDLGPNSLDISAAGHLQAGEAPEEGVRELSEELGISVSARDLRFVGIHLEVYADERSLNREFQYVYLFRHDRPLAEYRVQPEEVAGLTAIGIDEGLELFGRHVDSVPAQSVIFDNRGVARSGPFAEELTIDEFLGGSRNNYFAKVLVLARGLLADDRHLYI